MISVAALINLVVYLVVLGLIFFVVFWAIDRWKARIPEPIVTIIEVLAVLILVILLINVLLGVSGHPLLRP